MKKFKYYSIAVADKETGEILNNGGTFDSFAFQQLFHDFNIIYGAFCDIYTYERCATEQENKFLNQFS